MGLSVKQIKALLLSLLIAAPYCFSAAMAETPRLKEALAVQDQRGILADINNYRFKKGLAPLKMNAIICKEAENHSRNMARNTVPFSHVGFNKRSQRLFSQFKQARGIAENVAYNYSDAKRVVQQWLASSGHRENIEGDYNLTGIGLAWDKNNRVYVTEIFLHTVAEA